MHQRDSLDERDLVFVATKETILGFGRTHGRLLHIRDVRYADDLIKAPHADHGAPISLSVLGPGRERIAVRPGPVTHLKQADGALVFTHDWCEAGPEGTRVGLAVRWTIEAAGGEFVWSCRVWNRWPEHVVCEVVYPMIKGLFLGGDHRDDCLVYPHHAGELTKNPVEAYASARYEGFWRAGSKRADGEWIREIPYCGLASMQWMDYFDPDGGIYLASHDDRFGLTGVIACSGGGRDPWFGMGFRKHPWIEPGSSWESRPFVLAFHDGDWRAGARRYRSWIEGRLEFPRPPEDLAIQAALYPHYDFKNHRGITYRFADIPRLYDAARADGIRHFFIAGWNRGGFDKDYPEYQPDMDLGSNLDLEKGCRYIAEKGGIVTFYINARIFDTGSSYFEPLGREWAIKDHAGGFTHEQYDGTSIFGVMCPGAAGWRKHLHDAAVWMARAYHARGIYLDQLGSATPLPCYDQSHSHLPGDAFNQGYLRLLEEIKGSLRAERPDAFLMIENCGDIYSPHVFANLTWNGAPYDEFFDLYKYTFPEFLQINMVNPRRIADRDERARWFFRDLRRAFLLGSIFWAEIGERFGPEDRDLLASLRRALRMRQHLSPFLLQARFIGSDELAGLAAPGEKVDLAATNWHLPGEGRLLIAANDTGTEQALTLELEGESRPRAFLAESLGPDGWKEPVRLIRRGSTVEVPIGSASLTAVLLRPET